MAKQRVAFAFVCDQLPARADLYLGLQQGSAIVQEVRSDCAQAVFDFVLDVQFDEANDTPRFTGRYAHGSPTNRFVYLCWVERRDNAWAILRRAKVPLGGLSARAVHDAIATDQPLRARITLSDAHGEPVAASLTPEHLIWE